MDVSIIVPLYKGKGYVNQIIQMICENQKVMLENQMTKDVEIVFINDYPDEKISDIDFGNENNILLRLYTNEDNLGIHESRLRGLSKAKGQYIVFLDQDDEISPYYLYRQFKCIGQSDAVLCNGIYRNNRKIYKTIMEQKQAATKEECICRGTTIVSPGQIMIRKKAIPDLWRDCILRESGHDDLFLWVIMLSQGKEFSLNPHSDYVHKEDGKNTSFDFMKMKRSVEELLKVVKDEKILETKDLMIFTEMIQRKICKYESYNNVLINWDYILQNLISLIHNNGYKKVAIYGYGVIGKKLLNDLEKANVKIEYVIDQAASNFENVNYKINEPDNLPEGIELIIITALFDEKQIRKDLENNKAELYSLDEILNQEKKI